MDTKKSTKFISLAIASLMLIGLIIGGYFLFRPTSPNNDETPITPPQPNDTITVSPDDNFIFIEGGTFTMGSPTTESYRDKDEVYHNVTVSSLWVDPYEVSQGDYERLMGSNPSHFRGNALPVENVTWYQAIEYCNAKSTAEGLEPVYQIDGTTVTWNRAANGYRLLTEAEWEFVARAGTTTVFPTGNFMHTDYANYQGSYPYLIEENYSMGTIPSGVSRNEYFGTNRGTTIRVDSLPPNAYGIYNMNGNVSEWCFDFYGEYDLENTINPAGALSGSLRVNRGGGYNDFCKHLRSAYRSATNPIDGDQNLGFRICRNAEEGEGSVVTTYSLNITIPSNPRVLVAYFSYSGNTEEAARMIAEKTGADLIEITRQSGDYNRVYPESAEELKNWTKPALRNHVEDMSQYDVIILGYPTWWATTPMPIVSFLEEYDFSGKTILPFSSHGGTMYGDSVSQVSKLAPLSYIGCGYEFYYGGSSSSAISQWLSESGVPEK